MPETVDYQKITFNEDGAIFSTHTESNQTNSHLNDIKNDIDEFTESIYLPQVGEHFSHSVSFIKEKFHSFYLYLRDNTVPQVTSNSKKAYKSILKKSKHSGKSTLIALSVRTRKFKTRDLFMILSFIVLWNFLLFKAFISKSNNTPIIKPTIKPLLTEIILDMPEEYEDFDEIDNENDVYNENNKETNQFQQSFNQNENQLNQNEVYIDELITNIRKTALVSSTLQNSNLKKAFEKIGYSVQNNINFNQK